MAPSFGRRLLAACVFACCHVALVLVCFPVLAAIAAWETVRWLSLSVVLMPFLLITGLWQLLLFLPLIALLVGAIAVRAMPLRWPAIVAAMLLPLAELELRRHDGARHLMAALLFRLMDHRTLLLLDTMVPVAACGLAAFLVPRRLLRRALRVDPVQGAPR